MNQSDSIGARLREERMRLDMPQPAFGEAGGVTKKTQLLYESGERFPDAAYLAAVAAIGVDVLYVLTGSRDSAMPALDASERLLVDNYRRCEPEARSHLIQTSALLAAGIGAASTRPATAKASSSDVVQKNTATGAVMVGQVMGGKVRVRAR